MLVYNKNTSDKVVPYRPGELSQAASCYCMPPELREKQMTQCLIDGKLRPVPEMWPFPGSQWKVFETRYEELAACADLLNQELTMFHIKDMKI